MKYQKLIWRWTRYQQTAALESQFLHWLKNCHKRSTENDYFYQKRDREKVSWLRFSKENKKKRNIYLCASKTRKHPIFWLEIWSVNLRQQDLVYFNTTRLLKSTENWTNCQKKGLPVNWNMLWSFQVFKLIQKL